MVTNHNSEEGTMLVAERVLTELVRAGRVSFNVEDLKGKTAIERKLLYRLGAYHGKPMGKSWLKVYGIRYCKKLIDRNIDISETNAIDQLLPEYDLLLSKYKDILGSKFEYEAYSAYLLASINKALDTWKDVKRGRDLFVKGLGGFDIEDAYIEWNFSRDHNKYSSPIITKDQLICIGYLKDALSLTPSEASEVVKDKELLKWLVRTEFEISRLDELTDALVLGLFNTKMSLRRTMTMLDDMVTRNLKLTWRDKHAFNCPEAVVKVAKANGMTIPKNGIELKQQAKRFKNCAGNYVNKILSRKSYIIYNDEVMLELSPSADIVIQAYGPMNKQVSIKELTI